MTFVLPPPTGNEQATVPLPTTTIKLVPGVGAGDGTPSLARLIDAPWHMKGNFNESNVSNVNK
jgi:hypothetical protein